MYIYVSVKTLDEYYKTQTIEGKLAIEKAIDDLVLIIPFEKLSLALVKEIAPKAIIFGGFYRSFESFEAKDFLPIFEVISNQEIPMLCICGSHQLLGHFYLKNIQETSRYYDEPIRLITGEDEGPIVPGERAKYFYARGFYQIHRVKEDKIFEGLGEEMYLKCIHYAEQKELPDDFEVLACSGHCGIEAMKHKTKILYGLQFHPEKYEEPFYDGKKILQNFSHIVNQYWESK